MFRIWLKVRAVIDGYFRKKRLCPRLLHATTGGVVYSDIEDIHASEPSKNAHRAGYWALSPGYRPEVNPEDLQIMRRSLNDRSAPAWHAHVHESVEGPMVLQLTPGLCEELKWQEGDRISFRRLYSGELITAVDRRARS